MARLLGSIYSRTGVLCTALQSPDLQIDSCAGLVRDTMESLASLLNNQSFNSLYEKCKNFSTENNLDLPKRSRQKKVPVKFQGSLKEIPVFVLNLKNFIGLL